MQKIIRGLSLVAISVSYCYSMPITQAADHSSSKMIIAKAPFGETKNGQSVDMYTLKNANGLTAKVITFGAIIYSFEAPDKEGHFANVTANCASIADYENRSPCFGALIGRYANRIARGKFTLDGRQYSLPLNGGANHI